MTTKQIADEKKNVAVLPKAEALPKWREWAAKDDVPKLQEEAFADSRGRRTSRASRSSSRASSPPTTRARHRAARRSSSTARRWPTTARSPRFSKALKESDSTTSRRSPGRSPRSTRRAPFDDVMTEYRAGSPREGAAPRRQPGVRSRAARGAWSRSTSSRRSRATRARACASSWRRSSRARGDPKWTDTLIKLVQDKSVEVAREAAVGLGKIANEQAMQPLLDALDEGRQGLAPEVPRGAARRRRRARASCSRCRASTSEARHREVPDEADLRHAPRARGPARRRRARRVHRDEPAAALEDRGGAAPRRDRRRARACRRSAWRMKQDPLKLYNNDVDESGAAAQDDNERVVVGAHARRSRGPQPGQARLIRAQADDGVLLLGHATSRSRTPTGCASSRPWSRRRRSRSCARGPTRRTQFPQEGAAAALPEELGDGAERAPLRRLDEGPARVGHPREAAPSPPEKVDATMEVAHAGRPGGPRHDAPRDRRRAPPTASRSGATRRRTRCS